jgi:hypothetical protein
MSSYRIMRESKIDKKTGKTLYKVQPDGLPAIWIEDGHCQRCESYGRCLGFQGLTEEDWKDLQQILNTQNLTDALLKELHHKYQLDLSVLKFEMIDS